MASSSPAGNGGESGALLTKCAAGTGIFAGRPASAVSRVGIPDFALPNMGNPSTGHDDTTDIRLTVAWHGGRPAAR